MNPALLAVFAHPDDESFGTGGTLAKYATNGTRGEVGEIGEQGYGGWRHGLAGTRSLKSVGGTAAFEAVADRLGLTSDQLRSELRAGKTLAALADEKGVDLQTLRDAAARDASRKAVEQAVSDGTITREHGDWLLEGLDAGYWGAGGFGYWRGFGGVSPFKPTPAPQGVSG